MSFSHRLTLTRVDVFAVRANGGVSPNMALGQMPTRPGLLVRLEDTDGCEGWGEIWSNFPPRANLHKAHLVQDVLAAKLKGLSFTDPEEAISILRNTFATYFLHVGQQRVFEHLLAGLDTALWDLALRAAGVSFASHMNLVTSSARTYASSINPTDLDALMPHHARLGQTGFKLKIGFDDAADRAFVQKASEALPPKTRLMFDSNQVWDLSRAHDMLKSLEAFEPVFAEEPIPANANYENWERLAGATSIPLAAGENVYGVEDFLRMTDAGVRFVQPDVAKWGGVTGALALAKVLPVGVSLWPHFLGTAVGQMASLAVSAAIGDESTCEMDVNTNALRTRLCGDALNIVDGRVRLNLAPGLVVPPAQEALGSYTQPHGA